MWSGRIQWAEWWFMLILFSTRATTLLNVEPQLRLRLRASSDWELEGNSRSVLWNLSVVDDGLHFSWWTCERLAPSLKTLLASPYVEKPAMQINHFGSSDHSLSGELTITRPKRKFSKWQMPSDQRDVIKLHLVVAMHGKCITVIDNSITHTWASLDDNGMTKISGDLSFRSLCKHQVQSGCSWRQSMWLD